MAFQGPRFMHFHRIVFVAPIVLLTLTCLYTSFSLSPFHAGSPPVLDDGKCFSCEKPSFAVSKSFFSLGNLESSSYIKDVVLRQNVLKVEDSRGETSSGPASRHDTNGLGEVVVNGDQETLASFGSDPDMMSRIREEELSHVSPPFNGKAEESPMIDGEPVREELGTVGAFPSVEGDDVGSALTKEPEKASTSTFDISKSRDDLQLENRHLTSEVHILVKVQPELRSEDHFAEQLEVGSEGNMNTTAEVISDSISEPSNILEPLEKEAEIRFKYDNMTEEIKLAAIDVENLMDSITESAIPKLDRNSSSAEYQIAIDRNSVLRGGAPQGSAMQEHRSCKGRQVFVYDLPSKFNADLVRQCDTLLQWFNFCDYFTNEGMGLHVSVDERNDRGEQVLVPNESWYLTHQYALELIFHARLKHYPCLTTDPNLASLFFVPYYAGLDVIRWHFRPNVSNDLRDALTNELISWLETQETWQRHKGLDHVLVLGKIGWDFRRPSDGDHWGSMLLRLPPMFPVTKLLIERNPWHENDVGVPHPTFFHPKDDDEIWTWLAHAEKSERRHLVSFAGMPRPNMLGNVRGHLIQQCLDNPTDCFLLRCEKTLCLRPDSTMNLFLHSHFCMQPPGDSPTRRSVFDSLVGGCIPVLFDPYTAYYQYPWHLPSNASSYSVFIPSTHVMEGKANIVEILKRITPQERTAMRTRIIREIIPGLLYFKPGTKHSAFRDAFDISMEALLNRVANMRAEQKFL